MKLLILMLISTASFSQPFMGLGGGNKGANGYVGVVAEKLQLQLSYQVPLISEETPSVASLNIGYVIGNTWSITPLVGLAWTKRKDFTLYDKGGEITTLTGFKPLYGFEAGYSQYMGKVFIFANNFSYGVGVKIIFK